MSLQSALVLHALGCNVIPLRYDDPAERKRPLHSWARWQTERQTEAWIASTWGRHPAAGVALICGKISGVVAVDCDSPEAIAWADANLPPTPWRVLTGKGQHRFYKHPGGEVMIRNRAKLKGIGLDIRGDGGYVVAPPSLHPTGLRYAWLSLGEAPPSLESLAELPTFLPVWIADEAPAVQGSPSSQAELPAAALARPPVTLTAGADFDEALAERRAAGWMAKRDGAVQGNGGDQHTYNTCATLVRDFGISTITAWRLLKAWNSKCAPPWEEKALWAKLNSAARSGQAAAGSKPDRELSGDSLIAEARAWADETGAAPSRKAPAAKAERASKTAAGKVKPQGAAAASGAGDVDGDADGEPPADAPTDPRPMIWVDGDPQLVYQRTLELLGAHPEIYVGEEGLCRVGAKEIGLMGAGAIMRALLDVVRFAKQSGRYDSKLVPAPDWLIKMLLELPREDERGLRRLDSLVHSPFWTATGQPVTAAGYNAEARVVLLEPPTVVAGGWASGAEALQWIVDEVLCDFPFENVRERANALGMLLVPIVRRMIDGPIPLHNIEAARRGTGKSKLAEILLAIHGIEGKMGPLPGDEVEIEKRVLSALRGGTQIRVWDNLEGYVNSPALAVLLTSRVYTGRLLQVSKEVNYPNEMMNVTTANNARFGEDLARRTVRIRMVSPDEFPEMRQGFRHQQPAWTKANRGLVLSALWQAVSEWVTDGKPAPGVHLRMGSYEEFVRVIGGILWHAGQWDWLDNLSVAREEQSSDADEWPAFIMAWWKSHATILVSAKQLLDLAEPNGLLLEARGPGHESAQLQRLSRSIRARRQAVVAGLMIDAFKDPHEKALRFRLVRTSEYTPPPEY